MPSAFFAVAGSLTKLTRLEVFQRWSLEDLEWELDDAAHFDLTMDNFKCLTSLRSLRLGGLFVVGMDYCHVPSSLSNLEALHLHGMDMESFTAPSSLCKLKTLTLGGNRLDCVQDDVSRLLGLTFFSLGTQYVVGGQQGGPLPL